MLDTAYSDGVSLSQLLEREDPTGALPPHEQFCDAFTRQLMRLDIRTASDPVMGAPAHNFGRFFEDDELGTKDERSIMASEWLNRTYRRAAMIRPDRQSWGNIDKNGRIKDTGRRLPFDQVTSYDLFPPAIAPGIRYAQVQPSMLEYLVALTRTINAEATYALYLTDNVQAFADARMARVEEYAEVPAMRVATSEVPTRVKKYGRRIDMSYEVMRRMSMDMVTFYVEYIAAVASREKEDQALDVLINGDGNAGTAATSVSGSTLDAAAAGKLTLKMYLLWRMKKFTRPYTATAIAGLAEAAVDVLLLTSGSANLAPGAIDRAMPSAFNYTIPRSTLDGVVLIDNPTVASNVLLGVDGRYALEMLLEAGSEIAETNKIISNQYNQIVITENVGFDILIKQKVGAATQTLAQLLAYTI